MGKLEQKSRKRSKRKHLQQVILATVATAGILGAGLLAPNVIGAMAKLGLIPNRRQKEYVGFSASKMVKKGLMKFNGKFYELTLAGQAKLRRWEFENFKFKKPKKWDGKWRVFIFDIPDKKRQIRDQIRTLFKSAEFYPLQESVWAYPYDCEDVIALLKTDFGIGKDLLYLIVDELENDKYLREWFKLI
ncbi:MAG: hypothetical protein A2758_00865 [Candidatus Zambryskibacteria bacterium RIFCSPHIGHO2_01_FULL_49_18]|uniref:Transcriptional repressor PaaX-like central Cas2-like domain-containing protein n=2 Tax=Candidatus Zambryskiibacteriota TaxID=1817925 RepID=A0A1G2T3D6_9BACT|nr:MAG: hypothetical protein A2758_00865 [Candidatus Zambryskibacteria bacterium RIFCSPHIGHO2_01_FULL_49_18]OHB05745.1 MAG: hypothetical protein A3A26_03620 [Candidatus Zambryskibacteria bacterium RIFCSPLOWO2_01_FULL_47_14]